MITTLSPPLSPASLAQEAYQKLLTPRVFANRWIPHQPTEKQALFLCLPVREAMYGGAAGGGKSDALLMAALMYVDEPGYSALILRRTYADLALPGAIMDRAHQWLGGTAAHWNETEKTWIFPNGATLTFGYLQYARDHFRYQGAEFHFVGFDELTQFEEAPYRYLFSRLRRLADSNVPIRMRAASNPGGIGHDWVFQRFMVRGPSDGRFFVPAKLEDNPHLDREAYEESLSELDDITRDQLRHGLWVKDRSEQPFHPEWWDRKNRYDVDDPGAARAVKERWLSYDTAFKDKTSSDFTGCVVFELQTDWRLRLRHIYERKMEMPALLAAMEADAARWNTDGKLKKILVEDRGSGTSAVQVLRASGSAVVRRLLHAWPVSRSKTERARDMAIWCARGGVLLPYPSPTVPWLSTFAGPEGQLFRFPDIEHDDTVDAFVQGIGWGQGWLRQWNHREQRRSVA